MVSPQAVVGFLDHDYRYKSLATQIPHNAGLARIRHGTAACEAFSLPLHHKADDRFNSIPLSYWPKFTGIIFAPLLNSPPPLTEN